MNSLIGKDYVKATYDKLSLFKITPEFIIKSLKKILIQFMYCN
jgi:hypothetical protein